MADGLFLNHELSKLFNQLWDADVNRFKPGRDYTISLQVTRSPRPLRSLSPRESKPPIAPSGLTWAEHLPGAGMGWACCLGVIPAHSGRPTGPACPQALMGWQWRAPPGTRIIFQMWPSPAPPQAASFFLSPCSYSHTPKPPRPPHTHICACAPSDLVEEEGTWVLPGLAGKVRVEVHSCLPAHLSVRPSQGRVGFIPQGSHTARDNAAQPLFLQVDEERLQGTKTFAAFISLLDNYETATGEPEVVTAEEEAENHRFLDAILDTTVMKVGWPRDASLP
uniref:Uridylate-specific endoribonuclease n=1 Tax=Ornithorhynchus anatinus TaxID=9258 RepID=A0A6I8PCA3_ORNAN